MDSDIIVSFDIYTYKYNILLTYARIKDRSIDAEGYGTCPACKKKIQCGPGGFTNLEKRHLGTQACRDYKAQQDRSKMKNTSILSFYKKATPISKVKVPATTEAPTRIGGIQGAVAALHVQPQSASHANGDTNTTSKPSLSIPGGADSAPGAVQDLAAKLQELISNLPPTPRTGSDPDPLAIFTVDPQRVDNLQIPSDDLWEELLNGMFKDALGWGTSLNVANVVENGRAGLDGLVSFVKYFVRKRGVSEQLIEGKLTHLMDGLKVL